MYRPGAAVPFALSTGAPATPRLTRRGHRGEGSVPQISLRRRCRSTSSSRLCRSARRWDVLRTSPYGHRPQVQVGRVGDPTTTGTSPRFRGTNLVPDWASVFVLSNHDEPGHRRWGTQSRALGASECCDPRSERGDRRAPRGGQVVSSGSVPTMSAFSDSAGIRRQQVPCPGRSVRSQIVDCRLSGPGSHSQPRAA